MLLPRLAGRFPTASHADLRSGVESGTIYPLGVIVFACTIGAISALFALLAYRYFRTGNSPGPRGDGVVSTTTAGMPQGVVRIGRLMRSRVSRKVSKAADGKVHPLLSEGQGINHDIDTESSCDEEDYADDVTMTMDEVTEVPKNHLVTCLEADSAMLTDEEDIEDREIFL